MPQQVVTTPSPTRQALAPFRPRDCPALRTIGSIYRVAAILVGVFFCIAELILVIGFMNAATDDRIIGSVLPSFLWSQLILISSCASMILTFIAIAEAIKVGLDIQNNTHAAAHFSEQTAHLSRAA